MRRKGRHQDDLSVLTCVPSTEIKKMKGRTDLRGKKFKNLVNLLDTMSSDNDKKATEQECSLELTEVRAGDINLESEANGCRF